MIKPQLIFAAAGGHPPTGPTALFQHTDRGARGYQMAGSRSAGKARTDDGDVDLGVHVGAN